MVQRCFQIHFVFPPDMHKKIVLPYLPRKIVYHGIRKPVCRKPFSPQKQTGILNTVWPLAYILPTPMVAD